MKSKDADKPDDVQQWRDRAAAKLKGLKGKALVEALGRAVEEAEKEMGSRFRRYRGKMAEPRRLRRAQ